MKEQPHSVFFVEITDPEGLRRNILEVIKDIIQNLQRFERFKSMRREKTESIKKLKSNIDEMHKLFLDLRHSLPETKIRPVIERAEIQPARKAEIKEVRAPKKTAHKESSLSELGKLQDELSSIEKKLEGLR